MSLFSVPPSLGPAPADAAGIRSAPQWVVASDVVPLAEASARSGLPPSEIYRRLRRGTLPAVYTRDGYQIPRRPFEAWLFARRTGKPVTMRRAGEYTVAEVAARLKQPYRAVLRHLKTGRLVSRWDGFRHWIRLAGGTE